MAEQKTVEGIALAAGDAVYFIPADDLATYRVPDELAGGLDSDVAGFGMGDLMPGIVEIRAFRGPVGRRALVAIGPDDDTVIGVVNRS